jgi:hypothetical protein
LNTHYSIYNLAKYIFNLDRFTVCSAGKVEDAASYLVGRGLPSIGVAFSVGVEILVVGVVVDVVAVVVVVGVTHQQVDNVEDGEKEGDDAECAHAGARYWNSTSY